MKWIYDLSYEQLKREIIDLHINKFVVDQVFQWIYKKNSQSIDTWSNISKTNRVILSKQYDIALNKSINIEEGQQGIKKFLFELKDKKRIESVLIKEKSHYTFCISTQVGCALKCQFCATGRMGFKRNLSSGEILTQILALKKALLQYRGKINIVFMGMG